MQTIYQASNSVEAHMLKNMLEQENIAAFIEGEYLQGGVGELPSHNLVRLVVAETDAERAKEIIDNWNEIQDSNQPATENKPQRRLPTFILVFFGMVFGVMISLAFFRTHYDYAGNDHDHDGQLDEKWTYSPTGVPLLYEGDRNLDKKIDVITDYNRQGLPEVSEFDDNFDGIFETTASFDKGYMTVSKTDTDGDGFSDFITNYKFGVMTSIEYINVYSGYPKKICSFDLGKLKMCEIDSNLDRAMDKQIHYDADGEVKIK
jgi:hypothetical protein